MSKLADEIIKQLFTDWIHGKPVPRLIQEGTGGSGWSENAVRAVIKAAEQSVHPTRRSVAQKSKSKSKGSAKPARG